MRSSSPWGMPSLQHFTVRDSHLQYRKFTQALEQLWDDSQKKPRSIHIHLYETLHRPHAGTDAEAERELNLNEALALLEGRKYTPVKKSIWQKLDEMEHLLRHPTSIFAMKTAAAAVTFAVIIDGVAVDIAV
jgi:hypothetical protein